MAKTQISRRGGSRRRGGTRKGGFKKRGGTRKGGFRKRGGGFFDAATNLFKKKPTEEEKEETKPDVEETKPDVDAPPPAPVEEEVVMEESSDLVKPEFGGRRKKSKKGKKTKMNGFFTAMLKAKKNGDKQFKYKGKTYKRHKSKTGLDVYKKA